MIELVAFDFDRVIILYRDGEEVARLPYYYDGFNEQYTYEPAVHFLTTVFDDTSIIMHVPYDFFVEHVSQLNTWNNKTVLELARTLPA